MKPAASTVLELHRVIKDRFGFSCKLDRKPFPEVISCGIPNIDFPRGTLSEMFGPDVSGKTSVLISALAEETRRPAFCALVDTSDSFDPASAAGAGVELNHLLWVRCGGNVEAALKAADILAHAGGFGILALDLAGAATRQVRRIPVASWFRLRQAVRDSSTALIVVENELNAHSCSTLQIAHRPVSCRFCGRLLRGIVTSLTVGRREKVVSNLAFEPFYQL